MSTTFHRTQTDDTQPGRSMVAGHEMKAGTGVRDQSTVPAADSPRPGLVSGLVRASGRTRNAGYWISGGGLAVLLSAFLPWASMDGIVASHPTGGGVLMLLAIGGLFAYLGGRILQDRLSRNVNIALWVLSGVDIILTLALFATMSRVDSQGSGVTPAIGFYVGIGGLVASVAGTVMARTVLRRKEPPSSQPASD
jgi:hypothetical protein